MKIDPKTQNIKIVNIRYTNNLKKFCQVIRKDE